MLSFTLCLLISYKFCRPLCENVTPVSDHNYFLSKYGSCAFVFCP